MICPCKECVHLGIHGNATGCDKQAELSDAEFCECLHSKCVVDCPHYEKDEEVEHEV